jgi:alpha-beta hydrolase superfamily lysophospholipase
MHYGARLKGLLLSGSSWPQRIQLLPGRLLAKLESWRLGKRGNSGLINALGFSAFNRRFRPVRTEMDWLSRDEAEVDKYVADPLCGGLVACGWTSSAACSSSDPIIRSHEYLPTFRFS